MTCNVIATGSSGNAVLLDGHYLIDCGVSFSKIRPYIDDIRLVFLTHAHSDHFNPKTVRAIAEVRPGINFICGAHMVSRLIDADIPHYQIIPVSEGQCYSLAISSHEKIIALPFNLIHNIPNVGWIFKIEMKGNGGASSTKSALYATDTRYIPIAFRGADLYLVEANYTEADLEARRNRKLEAGEFSYEDNAALYHMSYETITKWLAENAEENSKIVFLHRHIDRERKG